MNVSGNFDGSGHPLKILYQQFVPLPILCMYNKTSNYARVAKCPTGKRVLRSKQKNTFRIQRLHLWSRGVQKTCHWIKCETLSLFVIFIIGGGLFFFQLKLVSSNNTSSSSLKSVSPSSFLICWSRSLFLRLYWSNQVIRESLWGYFWFNMNKKITLSLNINENKKYFCFSLRILWFINYRTKKELYPILICIFKALS